MKLWKWYQNCLAVHPVKTQMISSGVIWGFGDIAAQSITHYTAKKYRQIKVLTSITYHSRKSHFLYDGFLLYFVYLFLGTLPLVLENEYVSSFCRSIWFFSMCVWMYSMFEANGYVPFCFFYFFYLFIVLHQWNKMRIDYKSHLLYGM